MSTTVSRREKRLTRRAARNAWMRCGGNLEVADAMARKELEMQGIDPATLLLLLQIALTLWKWWQSQNVKEPSVVESSDEPIDWDEGDE